MPRDLTEGATHVERRTPSPSRWLDIGDPITTAPLPGGESVAARRLIWHSTALDADNGYDYATDNDDLVPPDTAAHLPNVVSSLCLDGFHRPIIDVDVPMHVVPSSTPGHHHLYFPGVALTEEQMMTLLDALAAAGIVEPGWARVCRARGQALLRLPGWPTPRDISVGNT